jgi:hypothetical protein
VKQIKTLDIRNKKRGVFRMLQEKLISFQPEVKGNSMAEYARDYQESMIMYQAFKTGIFEVLDGSHKKRRRRSPGN